MTDVVIKAENLSKRYLIGHQAREHGGYTALRDVIARNARTFARKTTDFFAGRQIVQGDEVEEFWALKDVNFEVKRGEVLGIIGRNGAGKSTLLKVLSRITEPSAGRVTIKGRVASLLEVGTGFHPELTGRENIFLNGAILGMTRTEIRRKFDEIVAFAEVEQFLDTPVKRYSSGMYVRLAFAVAAHLEPEILVVDEVLAVGDVEFQKKCLGTMRNVAAGGRTIVFVSHNLPAIIDLTERALLIDKGHLQVSGPSRDIVSRFLSMAQKLGQGAEHPSAYRRTCRNAGYVDIESVTISGCPLGCARVAFGQDIIVDVGLVVQRPVESGIININVLNEQLETITTLASADSGYTFTFPPGRHAVRCNAGPLPLIPGDYRLNVGTARKGGDLSWDVLEMMPGFRIEGDHNAAWLNWPDRPGVVLFENCDWSGR
jgi:lipopolysaccharide transport system ATP-binding protein